jgi:hypothetical protein
MLNFGARPDVPASLRVRLAMIGALTGIGLFSLVGWRGDIRPQALELAVGAALALLAGISSLWAP